MPSDQKIPVLERAVSLLNAVSDNPDSLSAKSLSMELGIPPATCYRMLRTFLNHGWLRENDGGNYRIGFGLARLTRSYSPLEQHLRDLQPLLKHLTRETGLSAKVSVREGDHAVSVARSEAQLPSIIASPIGARIRLTEAGSTGIILMGALEPEELRSLFRGIPQTRKQAMLREIDAAKEEGMARSYGTNNPSIHAVSIPVNAGCPAALTLIGWPENFSGKLKKEAEARLKNLRLPL